MLLPFSKMGLYLRVSLGNGYVPLIHMGRRAIINVCMARISEWERAVAPPSSPDLFATSIMIIEF